MTTPLIILALLGSPFLVSRIWGKVTGNTVDVKKTGLVGLALAFAYFASEHFIQTEPLAAMLPPWVPERIAIIYATGLIEWGAGPGAVDPRAIGRIAGWCCIAVLVLFFPANVYAAIHQVGPGGHTWGPEYLLIRGPLQIVLIFWTFRFAISKPPESTDPSAPT